MPILSMNAAVWQMETPAGLPDAAYHTAFQVFSTCNPAKSDGVSDLCFLQCGEWVMKSSEGGVQITVFAAGKLGNVIAMRDFRMVFRLFSGLFDD